MREDFYDPQSSTFGNLSRPPTDDRSHIIERSMNRRSGEEERKQDFINLDESDASAFDQEWKERTRQSSHILRDRQRATVRGLEEPRERTTHHSRHAGIAVPSRKDKWTIRDKDRLIVNDEGPGTRREFDNRHHDYGAARDQDWGSGDFEITGRSQKPRHDREKHVRVNSRPVNRHEPRGGL